MFVNQIYQGGIRALLAYDNTLFDNFIAPTDPEGTPVDLDLIINRILYKYGDAPLFTPDPAVIKFYIGEWSERRQPLWNRFYKAILEEYDPLSNYDRTEKTTDYLTYGHKVVTNDDLKHGHKVVTNDDLKHGHKVVTNDDLKAGTSVENQISADNASTYQPDNKAINSGTDERDIDETHSGTDERDLDETHSGTDERDLDETHSGTDKRDYDSHVYGNIGVMTSQQMLREEKNLIPELDLVEFIADDFHSEFNLMMYN